MHKDILLVEDNPDDVELTRIAFDEAKIANNLVVVGDGAEALDYLFARGAYAGRDAHSYIQKPVDFEQFVWAVKQVGLYWLVLNHPRT